MADLGGLLEQAQQVMAAQQAASEREIEGVAGGGVVRIRTTGTGQVLSVSIAAEVVDPDRRARCSRTSSWPPCTT